MREIWVDTPPDGSITCGPASKYLGIAPATLQVHCAAKNGPDNFRDVHDRVGRRYFLKADLDRWLFMHPRRGNPPGGRPRIAPPPARPLVREVPGRVVRSTDRPPPPPDAAEREALKAGIVRRRVEALKARLVRAERELDGLLIEGGP